MDVASIKPTFAYPRRVPCRTIEYCRLLLRRLLLGMAIPSIQHCWLSEHSGDCIWTRAWRRVASSQRGPASIKETGCWHKRRQGAAVAYWLSYRPWRTNFVASGLHREMATAITSEPPDWPESLGVRAIEHPSTSIRNSSVLNAGNAD